MDINNRVRVTRDIPGEVLFGDGHKGIAVPAGTTGVIVEQAVWNPSQVVQLDGRGDMTLFIPDSYLEVVNDG